VGKTKLEHFWASSGKILSTTPAKIHYYPSPPSWIKSFRCPRVRYFSTPTNVMLASISRPFPSSCAFLNPFSAPSNPQTRCRTPEFARRTVRPPSPHNGWNPSPSSPPPADDDLKKGPGLATQTSFDSDYQTGEFTSATFHDGESATSRPTLVLCDVSVCPL